MCRMHRCRDSSGDERRFQLKTYLVMIAGMAVLTAILSYGVPKVRYWHVASVIILACAWFALCLEYLG